jgi:photosynthetic reaction center cytochrome c subunit
VAGTSSEDTCTAWHGIKMVSDVNHNYMDPLAPVFPANRKGPQGDVLKVNCATCHNGLNKPLNGFSMAKDYPELSVPNP